MHMSEQEKEIERFLKKGQKRICSNLFLKSMFSYLSIGFAIGIVMNLISLCVPFYGAIAISVGIIIGILVIGSLITILRFPNQRETALIIDKTGFQERLITSLELKGKQDVLSELQKESTIHVIHNVVLKEQIPYCISRKQVMTCLLMVGMFFLIVWIPSPMKERAMAQHQLQQLEKENVEKIEEAKTEIAKVSELSKLEQQELLDVLNQAVEELKGAENEKEIAKAMERLETKLNQSMEKKEELISEKIQTVMDKTNLSNKTEKEQLAQDLKKKFEKMQQNQETNENKIDKELLESLADMLTEEQMKELLNQIDQANSDGSLTNSEMSQLAESLKEAAGNINLSQLDKNSIDKENQINQSNKEQNANQEENTNQEGNKEQENTLKSTPDANSNSNSSSGQSENSNSSSGQGNQAGQGNSKGQGEGSGNGSGQGAGSGDGAGSGNGTGKGKNYGSKNGFEKEVTLEEKTENVMVPNQEVGTDGNLTGNVNEDGTSYRTDSDQVLSWSGNSVEYNQVIGEYTDKAYSKIENNQVPQGMEDVVKSYFKAINE